MCSLEGPGASPLIKLSKELHSSKMAATEQQQLAPICPALRTLCKAPADPREITWHLNLLNRGQSHLVQVQLLGLGEFLLVATSLIGPLEGNLVLEVIFHPKEGLL